MFTTHGVWEVLPAASATTHLPWSSLVSLHVRDSLHSAVSGNRRRSCLIQRPGFQTSDSRPQTLIQRRRSRAQSSWFRTHAIFLMLLLLSPHGLSCLFQPELSPGTCWHQVTCLDEIFYIFSFVALKKYTHVVLLILIWKHF